MEGEPPGHHQSGRKVNISDIPPRALAHRGSFSQCRHVKPTSEEGQEQAAAHRNMRRKQGGFSSMFRRWLCPRGRGFGGRDTSGPPPGFGLWLGAGGPSVDRGSMSSLSYE
uniref:Uncharacterized protein n=1 Tax=Knipowitschia caucasica TaxID=637954 RepID=A0AAV2LVB6_KNICA